MPSVDIGLCPPLALTDVDPKFLNVRIGPAPHVIIAPRLA